MNFELSSLLRTRKAICPKAHRHASSVGLLASDNILGQALQGPLLRNANAGYTFA